MKRRIVRRDGRILVCTELGRLLVEIHPQPLSFHDELSDERLAREAVSVPALIAVCRRAADAGDAEAIRTLERLEGQA